MSKFLHDDDAADDDRAMTIPRRFYSKTAELKFTTEQKCLLHTWKYMCMSNMCVPILKLNPNKFCIHDRHGISATCIYHLTSNMSSLLYREYPFLRHESRYKEQSIAN